MSDPRTQPGYKQKHPQDRVELLLGAILEELIKLNTPLVAVTHVPPPRKKTEK